MILDIAMLFSFMSLIETEKKIKSILNENAAKKRKRLDRNIEKKKIKVMVKSFFLQAYQNRTVTCRSGLF